MFSIFQKDSYRNSIGFEDIKLAINSIDKYILINSIQVIILDLIFVLEINYMRYLTNAGFTFLFYPAFFIFFNFLNNKISQKKND